MTQTAPTHFAFYLQDLSLQMQWLSNISCNTLHLLVVINGTLIKVNGKEMKKIHSDYGIFSNIGKHLQSIEVCAWIWLHIKSLCSYAVQY